MRIKQKFKIFKQLKNWKIAEYFPNKLIKTNKKSWKSLLSTYDISRNNKLLNQSKFSLNSITKTKRWDFVRKLYKNGLELKRLYYHMFDYAIKNKILKRIHLFESKKYKENLFVTTGLYTIKPIFRLDILLSSLSFFNSIYEARNYIFSKNIVLNLVKRLHPGNILSTGDIINISTFKKNLSFKKIFQKKQYFQKQFFLFCEIDYYSKTIIIINDFSNIIKSSENPQIFFKKLDIRKFITYLKREY